MPRALAALVDVDEIQLPDDPETAAHQYVRLRRYATRILYAFLRNLGSHLLRRLEQYFARYGNALSTGAFIHLCFSVLPPPDPQIVFVKAERDFVIGMAALMLFQDIDVSGTGSIFWLQFVEFVIARSETIRRQAAQASITFNHFEFEKSQVTLNYRPQVTKRYFNKAFYWPNHPADLVVVFEEGQKAFNLHRPQTMIRRRKAEGHKKEDLLAAEFIPAPWDWVVTAANDKLLVFWDQNFNRIMRWELDFVVGALRWCPEVSALYAADHSSVKTGRVQVWRMDDALSVREAWDKFKETPKTDKKLDVVSGHTKPVQAMLWICPDQFLVTGSLDATVRIFDVVQMKRKHVLQGHTRGVLSLEYIPERQILLSSGFDHYVKLWDPGAGVCYHTLSGHGHSIVSMAAVPSLDYEIMTLDSDGVVKLWDLRRLECAQSFHAGDPQREKAGEIEALEPHALCMLERDRVLVSGRRMVLFDREASDPRLTADTPITAIAFVARKMEIVTTVKNDIRIWSALSGSLLTEHEDVIDSNITTLQFGLMGRRLFVGAERGQINVLNNACGSVLKRLASHSAEVTQIVCTVGKVLSLSTRDRKIMIHSDTDPKRSYVMKTIDLGEIGPVSQIDHDSRNIVAASTEDGDVYWFNCDSAKQAGSSEQSKVQHESSVPCCKYMSSVPLVATADLDGRLFFWSVQPLTPYDVFFEARLDFKKRHGTLKKSVLEGADKEGEEEEKEEQGENEREDEDGDASPISRGSSSRGERSPRCAPSTFGISCMSFSRPCEDRLFLGTEGGSVACVFVGFILEEADRQRNKAVARKVSGADSADATTEAAVAMDAAARESRFSRQSAGSKTLACTWVTERAHKGAIDQVVYCATVPPKLISLGTDCCVRLWSSDTGEALGALEQGIAEGLQPRLWRFRVDGRRTAEMDCRLLNEAVSTARPPDEDAIAKLTLIPANKKTKEELSAPEAVRRSTTPTGRRRSPEEQSLNASGPKPKLRRSATSGALSSGGGREKADEAPPSPASWMYPKCSKPRKPIIRDEDWLAGAMAASKPAVQLPDLASGLRRPPQLVDVVKAARRLCTSLDDARASTAASA